MLFQVITIAGQIFLAGDTVPEFKIDTCRAAESGSRGRDAQKCFQDEQAAKDKLKESWSSFDTDQKTHCQQLLKAGGMPSYVELLTCLEMKTAPTSTPAGDRPLRRTKSNF